MSLNDQTPSKLSDERLVERYRAGELEAFNVLVRRYEKGLFHFLMRFLNKPAAADDVFQEAFLQVHLSIDTFDTSRRFRPWLFTIAANKARDWLRRNKQTASATLSRPIDATAEDGREFADLLEARIPLPTEVAENHETQKLVQEVVEAMPDHLREILLLAYFERFAYKQIAEMLGLPLGTVKSRLHTAVATFAELWKQKYAG